MSSPRCAGVSRHGSRLGAGNDTKLFAKYLCTMVTSKRGHQAPEVDAITASPTAAHEVCVALTMVNTIVRRGDGEAAGRRAITAIARHGSSPRPPRHAAVVEAQGFSYVSATDPTVMTTIGSCAQVERRGANSVDRRQAGEGRIGSGRDVHGDHADDAGGWGPRGAPGARGTPRQVRARRAEGGAGSGWSSSTRSTSRVDS